MLTLLSFFLGVLVSFSVGWLEDDDEEELVLALESSSDIANPPPTPRTAPARGKRKQNKSCRRCKQDAVRGSQTGVPPTLPRSPLRPPLAPSLRPTPRKSPGPVRLFCKSDAALLIFGSSGGTRSAAPPSPPGAPQQAQEGQARRRRVGHGGAGREGPEAGCFCPALRGSRRRGVGGSGQGETAGGPRAEFWRGREERRGGKE